jgi:salicylate hydroxylase
LGVPANIDASREKEALPNDRLRVAIVGGGIGGLSAANALIRRGLDVTVSEQVETLREIGTGLSLFPNGRRQLERMGLKDALAEVGAKVGEVSVCRMDGSPVGLMPTTDSTGWNGIYGMHRADLSQTLAEFLPATVIRTAYRCIGFEQDARAGQLTFANGTTVEADVVIGADGIQSFLQKYVVEPSTPEYSGSRAYRGLVPREKLSEWSKETHQIWMGDGKHFMVYPVRRGELLNYVGFVPTTDETVESWSAVGDRDQLTASFKGGIDASSACSKKSRLASGGACMIAGPWRHGPKGVSRSSETPPMRCFHTSAKAPIRRLKMPLRWLYSSKGASPAR